MSRLLKHVSLHQVGGTELRVVSDVDSGLGPFIEVERAVIEKYAASPRWQQKRITLFILQDLEPLSRQLSDEAALPPGGLATLDQRPIVNVYDLKAPAACSIFVNQRAMAKEGYWDDLEAVRGLLAHEHAHPLSEGETTCSARRLKVDISTDSLRPLFSPAAGENPWPKKVVRLLEVVVDKLCLYAPREVLANDVAIASGFLGPLLYLDRRNVLNAAQALPSRGKVQQMLQTEAETGSLTADGAELLLAIADMKGYLDLAMETASFYRQDKIPEARELEALLIAEVMPHLEPLVAAAYPKLRDAYLRLPPAASPEALGQWEASVLGILAKVLKAKGLQLQWHLRVMPP